MSIYHRGLETNIDSNSSDYYRRFQNTENMDFNEQIIQSQRQTFWDKNRNLLFLVAGLVVGCFVTVVISYAFFSLGQNKGHGNCKPYDVTSGAQTENQTSVIADSGTKDNSGLKKIFVACTGNRQSVLDAWGNSSMGGDISNIKDSCTNRHLRSTLIDNWNGSLIDEVKVELFRNEQLAVEMFFDGRGSTSSNWFTRKRLRSNSFNDLTQMSTFNFFSMNGDQTVDRHFFINRNYGGCANDKGWMVVIDTADANYRPCKFDKLPGKAYPYILYGPDQQMSHYDYGLYAVADMMVISLSTLG
ncbi:uncharacterized protein [Mytilus edulis]|uniref:uncharacterized protein isoform X1 n=2 Tax=Mytilus edulis TaxID=6550 RepID=UPI0039EF4671